MKILQIFGWMLLGCLVTVFGNTKYFAHQQAKLDAETDKLVVLSQQTLSDAKEVGEQAKKLREWAEMNTLKLKEPSGITFNGGSKKILEIKNDGTILWYRAGKATVIENEKELALAFLDALNGLCPGKPILKPL